MSKKNMGSSIDDFLKEEGIFEEAQAQAVKEVVSWQLAEGMRKKKISKTRMAVLLKTSRTQVDRILDPKNDITLSSLQRGGDGWPAGDDRTGVRDASVAIHSCVVHVRPSRTGSGDRKKVLAREL